MVKFAPNVWKAQNLMLFVMGVEGLLVRLMQLGTYFGKKTNLK
jgi:hypothetical protein